MQSAGREVEKTGGSRVMSLLNVSLCRLVSVDNGLVDRLHSR